MYALPIERIGAWRLSPPGGWEEWGGGAGTGEALRESRERFESVFEYAAIGMGLVAPDGRWLRVNRALCKTLGYPDAELLGRAFGDITHPDDLDDDLEQAGRLLSGEDRAQRKDGRTVWALVRSPSCTTRQERSYTSSRGSRT